MYCTPGPDNSKRISTEKAVPINPENNANIKYNVPISLALDDKNHASCYSVGFFKFSFSIVVTYFLFNEVCNILLFNKIWDKIFFISLYIVYVTFMWIYNRYI